MKRIKLFLAFLVMITVISCKPSTTQAPAENGQSAAPAEMHKMITAKVYIKAGHEAEFAEAAKWIIENTLKEEGCLQYTLYQDPYNPTNFFFFERYKNQAAIDAHFAAPYFTEFGTKIGDLTSQASEITIWDIAQTGTK